MGIKKSSTKFTIQFNQTDPAHLQVAELLNKQGHRGKAQYIVNAVLHYENCDETPDLKRPAPLDEKVIEAVVNRILRDRKEHFADTPIDSAPVELIKESQKSDEEINFADAMDALGEDGFNAVAGALDMFRRK